MSEQTKEPDIQPAIDNLRGCQTQLDMDGCMVGVSRQALEEVLAEITRLRAERPGWQPISTAPKDGTEILVARGRQMGVVFWNGTRWSLGCAIYFNKPDVWQPRPALHPSVAEGRSGEKNNSVDAAASPFDHNKQE